MKYYPKNVLIITHMYEKSEKGGLPQEEVRNFLLDKSEIVTYLELPFPYAKIRRAYLTIYKKGKIIKQLKSPFIYGPEWLQYLMHIFITYYYLIKTGFSYELCIVLDNLTAIPIIPLRWFSLIKKIIYYSIDYSPNRFENKFLNFIYQYSNKIASRNADVNWAVSETIINEKKKRNILGKKQFLIVPVGFRGKDISRQNYKKIDIFHLVFVGILLEKQGLQMVLKAMPKLLKINKRIKLTIVGTGEYDKKLHKLTKKLKLEEKVKFTGFIKDPKKVENILTKAGIGLAPYKPISHSFTFFADPGKIKLYLGCGLPIITTSVPQIASTIKKNKAGEVIKYNESSLIKAIEKIFQNHKSYRESAIMMSKDFDYEKIYKRAFKNSN